MCCSYLSVDVVSHITRREDALDGGVGVAGMSVQVPCLIHACKTSTQIHELVFECANTEVAEGAQERASAGARRARKTQR